MSLRAGTAQRPSSEVTTSFISAMIAENVLIYFLKIRRWGGGTPNNKTKLVWKRGNALVSWRRVSYTKKKQKKKQKKQKFLFFSCFSQHNTQETDICTTERVGSRNTGVTHKLYLLDEVENVSVHDRTRPTQQCPPTRENKEKKNWI